MMKKRRVAGLIAIATIILFIVADIFFALNLPRQNFFTSSVFCSLDGVSFHILGNRGFAAFILRHIL